MNTLNERLRYCRLKLVSVSLVMVGLFLGSSTVQADSCMQDVWQAHGNTQSLTCTANDVSLSSVSNICIHVTPGGPLDPDGDGCQNPNSKGQLTCVSGQPVTFTANFTMPLTAQARYDLGLYIATDGGGSDGALTGACAANVVTSSNSSTYLQKDPPPDVCGDIDAAHNPQVIHQTITTTCSDTNNDGKMNLPWCTSWRQPGSNDTCDSATFTTAASFDAYPGSPSKCNCGSLDLDIFTETASITVDKVATTPTVLETGGSVIYSVAVTNNAQVSSITLTSLTDNLYGDITTTGHNGITATTCALVTIPAESVTPADNPYTCQFTVTVGPGNAGQTITDTVTACGSDQFGHSNICDDDPAMVTYTNVTTQPSLVKTATTTMGVQVDVQFSVVVTNNSTVDTLTLNTLSDNVFGDITSAHVAGGGFKQVVSTTCATGGAISPSSNYSCNFVGRLDSTGLHTDVVTGGATDDDSVSYGAPALQDSAQVNISVTFP